MGLFDLFRKKEENTAEPQNKGRFASLLLLDEPIFSLEQLFVDLNWDWEIDIQRDKKTQIDEQDGTATFYVDGMMVAVRLISAPVPNDEAVRDAKTSVVWEEAVEVAQKHKAYLSVRVFTQGNPMSEAAKLMVKVCASCLKQSHTLAVNTAGTIMEPGIYTDMAKEMRNGFFPILDVIYIGLYSNDKGKTFSTYTNGLKYFEKDELEIINSSRTTQEILGMIIEVANLVAAGDVVLKDGEKVEFRSGLKGVVRKSQGVFWAEETFKIEF